MATDTTTALTVLTAAALAALTRAPYRRAGDAWERLQPASGVWLTCDAPTGVYRLRCANGREQWRRDGRICAAPTTGDSTWEAQADARRSALLAADRADACRRAARDRARAIDALRGSEQRERQDAWLAQAAHLPHTAPRPRPRTPVNRWAVITGVGVLATMVLSVLTLV